MSRLLRLIFSPLFFQKTGAFLVLILLAWMLQDFLMLFFVTFLFVSVFSEAGAWLSTRLISGRTHSRFFTLMTPTVTISGLYILFVGLLIFIFMNILPQLGQEIKGLLTQAPLITEKGQELIYRIENLTGLRLGLEQIASEAMSQENLESLGNNILSSLRDTGVLLIKFLLALLLSYLFIIEREKVGGFLMKIKEGNFSFLYHEWSIIATKINNSFGLIFRAQAIIALVNAILTTLGLIVIMLAYGHGAFPYLLTLTLIVFLCGFIPVFGTFLSGIPILIIGYGFGSAYGAEVGIVLSCIAMISFIHAVEAYYLNPKIVSSYIHFPVFITFLTLLISEHLFGLIGLLIGVPLFAIILSFIEDIDRYISSLRTTWDSQNP